VNKPKQSQTSSAHTQKVSDVPHPNLLAYFRSLTDIPHARTLAQLIQAEETYKKTAIGSNQVKRIVPQLEAQHNAVTVVVRLTGVSQVIEIGAGTSPRGLNGSQWDYLHTDRDEALLTQMERAARTINQNGRKMPRFVKFDAITGEGLDNVMSMLRPKEKVAIVHEGFDDAPSLIGTVKEILKRYGGFYVTPDVYTTSDLAKMNRMQGNVSGRGKLGAHNTPTSTFRDMQHAFGFYMDAGLEPKEISKLGDLVFNISSLEGLFPNDTKLRSSIDADTKELRVWKMSLRV